MNVNGYCDFTRCASDALLHRSASAQFNKKEHSTKNTTDYHKTRYVLRFQKKQNSIKQDRNEKNNSIAKKGPMDYVFILARHSLSFFRRDIN